MLVTISMVIIAIAFVTLVVFAIVVLLSIRDSLKQVNKTISDMERKVDLVSGETVQLLQSTHRLTEDVNGKLAQVDHFFESVGDVGQAVQQVTSSVKQVSATVAHSLTGSVNRRVHTHQNKVDEFMQWANAALTVWQKINSLKSKK